MPRQRRAYSSTQIYHIMVRGNAGRDIFLDDDDKKQFLRILSRKKRQTEFKLYAFCLMKNHFHLSLKEGHENISIIMKRINTTYAVYFNKKYQLAGHLFQNRFKSENVEDDAYLISLIRYIHQNPVKAGIVLSPEEYPWSSCLYYFFPEKNIYKLIDIEDILKIFSYDIEEAKEQFKGFSQKEEITHKFLEYKDKNKQPKRINTEKKFANFVNKFVDEHKISLQDLFKRENKLSRDQLILKLKDESIYSNKDIAEFLGTTRGIIQNARRDK
jgi:REP element-mobilizing transposase RayT